MRDFESQIDSFESLQEKFAMFANERFTDRSKWQGRRFYIDTSAEDKNEHAAKLDFHFYAYFYVSILNSVDSYFRRIVPNQEKIPPINIGVDVSSKREDFRAAINRVYNVTENVSSEFFLPLLSNSNFPSEIYDDEMKLDRELYEGVIDFLNLIYQNIKELAYLNVGANITQLPFQYEKSENLVSFDNWLVDPIDKVSVQFSSNFKDFVKANRHFPIMGSLFESYEKGLRQMIDVLEIANINQDILLVDDASPHVFLQALMLIIKHVHEVRVNSFISRIMLDKSL